MAVGGAVGVAVADAQIIAVAAVTVGTFDDA
jgi:hypothetical protein